MKLRPIILFLLIIIPNILFGQYNYNFLKTTFFGRLPSARAEAMGKSYTSIDGDLTTSFFNPAGIASINELEINNSFATPYYLLKEAHNGYSSIGYKFNDYLVIGLTRRNFSYGNEISLTNSSGNIINSYVPRETNYSLSLASQPIKNLFLGLNTNYFIWNPLDNKTTAFYFDFGIIKKIEFLKKNMNNHSVNIAASIVNFNKAKTIFEFNGNKYPSELPLITRIGLNYQFTLNGQSIIDSLQNLKFLFQGEYQDVLNSDYETAYRTGGEILLFEIFSIRVGYYKETVYDYGNPSVNYSEINSLTYGFGFQIPLYKLTKHPVNINIDVTVLPQPLYSNYGDDLGNFKSFNLKLNWILKNEK